MGNNDFYENLGRNIERVRISKGESETDVAKAINISTPQLIGLWERAERKIKAIYLAKIADHFNVSPDYLLNWKEKKKCMISQPMNGKTDAEIVADRNRAIEYLESNGYEVVNTLFTDDWYSEKSMEKRGVVQIPLCFLAKSLENMSKCHVAYFVKGWENARGCKIEHDCAVAYGVEVIEE